MGNSNCIELVDVEDKIHSKEAAMVYLQEGNLLAYMEGIVKHDEIIWIQFFHAWKDKKVTANGMSFDISNESIVRAG